MKKKVAIVFGITDNYSFALANVLIGMKKHCRKFWDDIIIYTQNLEDRNKNNLNKILECSFVEYELDKFDKNIKNENLNTYSFLTMARFECFNLLNEYEYVIWHDVDILIQKDFSEMLKYGDETGFALTCDPMFCVEQNYFNCDIDKYNLLTPLYNAGVMVLKDILENYNEMYLYCYDTFNKNAGNLRYLDQSVLNMLIQDYKIDVTHISLENYCCHPAKSNYRDAAIIHAYGNKKFWNSDERAVQFPEWIENDKIWKNLENISIPKQLSISATPQISVVMYSNEYEEIDYAAINSILNQQSVSIELLVVNENVEIKDTVENKFDKFFNDERIRFIYNSNSSNQKYFIQNIIKEAKGKYIVFFNGKVYSTPNRFEIQSGVLDKNLDLFAIGSNMIVNSLKKEKPIEYSALKILSLAQIPVFEETVMFRKDSLLEFVEKNQICNKSIFWSEVVKDNIIRNLNLELVIDGFGEKISCKQEFVRVKEEQIKSVQQSLKDNLELGISYDEALLLVQPKIIDRCYNSTYFREKRRNVIDIIIKRNSDMEVYDKQLLDSFLNNGHFECCNIVANREEQLKLMFRASIGKKVIMWGTGKRCLRYLSMYPNFPIEFCVDSDLSKKGLTINNIPVFHISEIKNWKNYYVIITPVKVEEIKEMLEGYGLEYLRDFALGTDIF